MNVKELKATLDKMPDDFEVVLVQRDEETKHTHYEPITEMNCHTGRKQVIIG